MENKLHFCPLINPHKILYSYVCTYVYVVQLAKYICKHKNFQSVASSVITAIPMLMCLPVASQLYNITVTCSIHPDSTADQCVVMAMADGRVTSYRTGELRTCMYTVYMYSMIVSCIQFCFLCNILME